MSWDSFRTSTPARKFLPVCLGLALVAGAMGLVGCPAPPRPAFPHTEPEGALQGHRRTRVHVESLRAEARVDQRGRGGRIRGTVLMFVDRPDRVRFDAMTQFGPAAVLTSDGERFALSDLRENRYLEGPTCPTNIARLLGIPLSGAEVTRLLLGDTPRIQAVSQDLAWTSDGTYLVTLHAADGRRQEIELAIRDDDRERRPERQRLRLVRSQVIGVDGDTEWRARFARYRVVDDPHSQYGVAMPFQIDFVHPGHGADVRVRFKEMDLNVQPPPGAFEQSPRPGIPPEWVECDGGEG